MKKQEIASVMKQTTAMYQQVVQMIIAYHDGFAEEHSHFFTQVLIGTLSIFLVLKRNVPIGIVSKLTADVRRALVAIE
jgi:hypothetical protein